MARAGRRAGRPWTLLATSCVLLAGGAHAWTLAAGNRLPSAARTVPEWPREGQASIFDLELAEEWCTARGLKPLHLQAVYRSLFRAGGDLDATALAAAGLPRERARELCAAFTASASRVVETRDSAGGGRKLLVELGSGERVETVLIRHEHRSSGTARHTLCVSSQVGCTRRCTFCATGAMGLRAQLSSAQIVEQAWLARQLIAHGAAAPGGAEEAPLRNVVFMGMGEPLDNLDAVLRAARALTHMNLFALSPRQLTVSTVGGSAAAIVRLGECAPTVRLALSLHAATQPLRASLLPSARECPLPELAAALDAHARLSGCGAMLEYLLIEGVNDGAEDAAALAEFCGARSRAAGAGPGAFVNLIPYNPTAPGAALGYATPSDEAVAAFHARLRARGVNALVRWTSAVGRDAEGACGQLALDGPPRRRRATRPPALRMASMSAAGRERAGDASGDITPRALEARSARRLLEGVKLAQIVEELQARMGWAALAAETGVRCFEPAARPTVKSALKFLRDTEHRWARERCEELYLQMRVADERLGRPTRWGGNPEDDS